MSSARVLLVLLLTASLLPGYTNADELLVLIQKGHMEGFSPLVDHAVKPHAKGHDWIIATISKEAQEPLEQYGYILKSLDSTPWSQSYFLISKPGAERRENIPQSYRLLDRALHFSRYRIRP
jgi:hypothetical protein